MVITKLNGKMMLNLVQILGVHLPRLVDGWFIKCDVKMSDPGGIELYLYWKSTDLNRKPNFEVVAIPFVTDVESNALLVKGDFIQLQILNKYVNDDDLDKATLGECSGYLTVYPGYTSKRMEPPTINVRTYSIEWASVYIADEERTSFTVTMRASRNELGDRDDYFWGRFG